MTEAEPTAAVAEIWEGDALNRSKDAEILRTFTIGHLNLRENAGEPRTYVLNLDANWGAGKSFFLNRFKQHLEAHGHVAVYVNAWENDHSDDPFMTVVDEIHTELKSQIAKASGPEAALEKAEPLRKSATKIIGAAVLSGGKHFVTRYIGNESMELLKEALNSDGEDGSEGSDGNLKSVKEAVQKSVTAAIDELGSEVLKQFRHQKEVQDDFKEQLRSLGEEVLKQDGKEAPIFILIDELDRCRPSYAIELLERVKHIFSLENFVYILGTDTQQLANAIKGVYGSEFDGERYLKRFVDRTYHFQQSSNDKLIEYALRRNGLENIDFAVLPDYTTGSFLAKCFDETGTHARDIRQIIEIVGTFAASWRNPQRDIDIVRLLPLVYQRHFRMKNGEIYDSKLGTLEFIFQNRRRGVVNNTTTKTYRDMWREIDNHSTTNFENSDPANSFDLWVRKKNDEELSVFQLAKRQEAIGVEYARILDQVANITGPAEGA